MKRAIPAFIEVVREDGEMRLVRTTAFFEATKEVFDRGEFTSADLLKALNASGLLGAEWTQKDKQELINNITHEIFLPLAKDLPWQGGEVH